MRRCRKCGTTRNLVDKWVWDDDRNGESFWPSSDKPVTSAHRKTIGKAADLRPFTVEDYD